MRRDPKRELIAPEGRAALEHRTEKWDPLFGLIRCSIPLAGASVATENRVHFSVRRASPVELRTPAAAEPHGPINEIRLPRASQPEASLAWAGIGVRCAVTIRSGAGSAS